MYASALLLRKLRNAGVKAYLAKNEAPGLLLAAVERVIEDEPFFISKPALEPVPAQFLLTPKELAVLRELSSARLTNRSPGTWI